MKALKTLVAIALSTAGLGTAVTLGVVANNNSVVPAHAAGTVTFDAGTIIYLDPDSFDANNNWTGGRLGAWCWYKQSGAANDMWEEFSYDGMSGKYMFKLSHATTGFTMARYSGNSRQGQTSWGSSVWNSGDFNFETGKNFLYATGWFTGQWRTLTYHLAGSFNSWNGVDSSHVLEDGFDGSAHQAYTSITTTQDNVEIKVTTNYNGTVPSDCWHGTLESGYNQTYVGTKNGNILLKKQGTYEIYLKNSRKVWVQRSSLEEATTWAQGFLEATDSICSVGGTSADHSSVLSSIWSAQKESFESMTIGAKGKIAAGTENDDIADAHDRYIHIMKRYGNVLEEFEDGPSYASRSMLSIKSETTPIIIIVVSVIAVSATGAFFLLRRKRKEQ